MASVRDVAAYILNEMGSVSAMKLQKLVYYSQAWSMVWDERPLFSEHFEAWANGPVCPALFTLHRGRFLLSKGQIAGKPDALNKDERETVDAVLSFYGKQTPQWLSDLSHIESPWKDARVGVKDGDRCGSVITTEAMGEYYSSL